MKLTIFSAICILCSSCSSLPKLQIVVPVKPPEELKQNIESVAAHMNRYVELFNNEQADAIAEEIYLPPVIVKLSGESGDSTHTIMATESQLSDRFKSIFEAIKSEGWKESIVHNLDVDFKGLDMAFVHMEYDRLKENGEPILPAKRNASYVLLKYKSGWRIISVLGQSNPNLEMN